MLNGGWMDRWKIFMAERLNYSFIRSHFLFTHSLTRPHLHIHSFTHVSRCSQWAFCRSVLNFKVYMLVILNMYDISSRSIAHNFKENMNPAFGQIWRNSVVKEDHNFKDILYLGPGIWGQCFRHDTINWRLNGLILTCYITASFICFPNILAIMALLKHAYWNILKISPPKTESFQIKILTFFIFLSKHILWVLVWTASAMRF